MNCYNHPNVPAVAVCPVCGKAYCRDCMPVGTVICKLCMSNSIRLKVRTALIYLATLIVIGCIGYMWDFMGHPGSPEKGLSAYMLMSFCTGLYFLFGRFRVGSVNIYVFDGATAGIMMLVGFVLKLIMAFLIGIVFMPIVILWQLLIILKNVSLLNAKD